MRRTTLRQEERPNSSVDGNDDVRGIERANTGFLGDRLSDLALCDVMLDVSVLLAPISMISAFMSDASHRLRFPQMQLRAEVFGDKRVP
jgi:hypothetical protein